MQRGKHNLQAVLDDGLGKDLMNAGRFCFSCEQIFADRKCLEEHMCSAASHICSCGTEFTDYNDMLEHSTTHEPGHQVLDHETIKQRRIAKHKAEEAQLQRLQTGEVVWKAPKLGNVPSKSLPMKKMLASAHIPQGPLHTTQISQVPELYPSSQAPLLQNPFYSATDMKNIFAGVGAPTVDLWTLYQPVVLLQTVRQFNKKKPYSCSKCGQCFATKNTLVAHCNSHVVDKMSGCIGCGLLLSSRKIVPRYHVCSAPSSSAKFKLVTAKPLGYKAPKEARPAKSLNVQAQLASSIPEFRSDSFSQATHGTSNMQRKNVNIGTYNKSSQGLLYSKRQNPNQPKPFITLSSKTHSTNPSASIKNGQGCSVTPTRLLKRPATFATVVPSKPMHTSSKSNGFTCRVCHLPFESAQLLQRHKCARAQEFMAQRGGSNHKLKRMAPMAGQHPAPINGGKKLGAPPSCNMKINQVMTVSVDQGQRMAPVNGDTEEDMDDDCFIVENGPEKPAEMIYQVTSSVPIKT
ncbi:uncharacterized protein LOC109986646 [Xyrichtys novacula]|uniref:Uncharacterized protein LOC109986646 n=1 Tax=Xyrichtys novacula TaxID=13765 RepID=A0AAV1FL18_XYRNO|nr:uncharacterized protein LOC109986646 [Xyrichtys novacula]